MISDEVRLPFACDDTRRPAEFATRDCARSYYARLQPTSPTSREVRSQMVRADPIVERFEQAQNRLVLQASDLSLRTIADMVKSGAIDVAPEFQRRERWGPEKRSALIESFLLNIPVPPIYLAEDEFGSYSVIDGKQRITAIADFMNGETPLIRLERFIEIDGLSFSALPPPLQNFLTVRPAIRAVSLLRQSDPNLKYEVFHRLNSGGEPLNAQEIRNVLYRGPLNELIVDLGGDEFLRAQLKIRNAKSPNYRKMLDAEWVLRFLTLSHSWDDFSGDLRVSMDSFMARHQFADKNDLTAMGSDFRASLRDCAHLWGANAFKRPEGDGWRDLALAGMFDAQMIAVHQVGSQVVRKLSSPNRAILDATRKLFEDESFESSVRTATNTPSRLRYRVARMTEMLQEFV